MADPIKELLMAQVFGWLSGIRIAAGYRTDIGKNGFRWKSTEFQPDQCPGFDLRDVSNQRVPRVTRSLEDWECQIEIVAFADPSKPTGEELNRIESDIYEAVMRDYRFDTEPVGLRENKIEPVETQFQIRQTERVVCAVLSKWKLTYRTTMKFADL